MGVIMKKLAILLAAGLLVAAPLIAVTPTDTFAAAKKAKKAAPVDPNLRFAAALNDLGRELATYQHKPPSTKKGKK